MVNFVIPSIFTAIDKVTGPVRKMQGSIQEFGKAAEASLSRADRVMRPIGKAAAVVGTAIAGPLALAVNEAQKFETSMAKFHTIVSDLNPKQFSKYQEAVKNIGDQTNSTYSQVASNFEMVAGLNAKFAETAEGISAVSKASITLARASGDELGPSASNLVGIMNQFNLAATQADRVINVLAAGQAIGASSITQTAEAFQVFGAVADASNLSLEKSVALTQVLASKQIMGSEAGTALRGTLVRLKASGLGYTSGIFNTRDALMELNKQYAKLKSAKEKDALMDKVFGTINLTTGTILMNNIDKFDEFTKSVTGTTEAQKAAAINQQTFAARLEAAKNQALNLAVNIGEKLLPPLTRLANKLIPIIEGIVNWTRENPGLTKTIIKIAIGVAAFAYAVTAISGAIAIATKAMAIFNLVMAMNPIGLIAIAIAALIVLIIGVIKYWDQWGAAVALFMGPLGWVISLIQSFRNNWGMITKAFKEGGILKGLLAIGATILDVILMPLQQILSIAAKLTGFEWADKAAKQIEKFRKDIGINVSGDEQKPVVNPEAQKQDAITQRMIETKQSQNVSIDIRDKTGRADVNSDNNFVPIKLTSTVGF